MDQTNIDALEKALSLERFSRYLAWAGGDRARAVDLYTLNTQISEALYTPLQTLEVALRNRIHGVMTAAYHDQWFDEAQFQKGRQGEHLAKAKADLIEKLSQLSQRLLALQSCKRHLRFESRRVIAPRPFCHLSLLIRGYLSRY